MSDGVNLDLLVPWGYGTERRSLRDIRTILLLHYHPEYVRRLIAWLSFKNGRIGVGGTFRPDGTQPVKDGFAPEGKSFHQNQLYADGFVGACAVDLVAPDGPDLNNSHDTVRWEDVLPQGSAEAKRWGLHCNVGVPGDGEAWHIQPIEIDGWGSWQTAGSPAPKPNYPLPTDVVPTPPPPTGGTVLTYTVVANDSYWRIAEKVYEDGKGSRWPAIRDANNNVALKPGMVIKIPGRVAV